MASKVWFEATYCILYQHYNHTCKYYYIIFFWYLTHKFNLFTYLFIYLHIDTYIYPSTYLNINLFIKLYIPISFYLYIYRLIFFHINKKQQRGHFFKTKYIYTYTDKKKLKRLVNVLENLIFLNVIVAPRGADGIWKVQPIYSK